MMGRLRHRGPDSSGYYRDRRIALGHTRLAIIDLNTGAQPLSNEDHTVWITYNGEIFNYRELASTLAERGHIFKTKSDTEVIVHAYEEWGTSCFEHFNGQWALALWDRMKGRVVLSRDRLGIRPLYYAVAPGRILFASEIKAIFADRGITREFDPKGLAEVFTFWCPVPPRTPFRGVKELEPGHFALIENGGFKSRPYWSISFPHKHNESPSNERENADLLRAHLIKAAQIRFTESDVPVGAYLSGGIDSSITSSIVAKDTDAPLRTFSIRFSDTEFDEGIFQKALAERLGTDHRETLITSRAIGEVFPEVVWHAERPLLRAAPAPLFLLSRLVRDSGFKVVVTGEGADEVLAGYDIFRETKARLFLARNPLSKKRAGIVRLLYPWMARSPGQAPAIARAFFSKDLDPSDPGFSHRPRWHTTSSIMRLFTPEWRHAMETSRVIEEFLEKLPASHREWHPVSRAQWLEMASLLTGYILSAQGDRMLMAHSVEGRFPFLDCDLVDFANKIPSRHKLMGLDEKHILKTAFRDLIPDVILKRPKQPYRAPDAAGFFNDHSPGWVDALTEESAVKAAGLFSPKAVALLKAKACKVEGMLMSNTDNMLSVGILSTMLTHHHYIERDGRGDSSEIPPEPMTSIDLIESSLGYTDDEEL